LKMATRDTLPAHQPRNAAVLTVVVRRLLASQLRRNIICGNLAALIAVLINVIAYPGYLHFLGYKGFGVWLALGIVITAAQIGNLGVPNAVAKIVAERYGGGDIQGVRTCVTNALLVVALLGVIAATGVWLVRDQFVAALGFDIEHRHLARILLPYIGALTAYAMWVDAFNATLAGLGRMDITSVTQGTTQALGVMVSLVLLAAGHGIESLLAGTVVGYLALNIATATSVRRILAMPVIDITTIRWVEAARIIRFGGWLFGGAVANLSFSPLNKLMLARYAGVGVLPVYEIAFTGAMRIRGLIESGLRALMLEVSSAVGAGPARALAADRKVTRAFYLTLWCGLAIFSVLAVFSGPLLRVWLGHNLHAQLPGAFRMMLAATFVSLLCVPAYYKLLGSGRVRLCFLSSTLQAGLNAVILFLFLWMKHTVTIMDTCWAVVASMTATSIYVLYQGRPSCPYPDPGKLLHNRRDIQLLVETER
jgi:O-antigen/teichoic acid export membrane protein